MAPPSLSHMLIRLILLLGLVNLTIFATMGYFESLMGLITPVQGEGGGEEEEEELCGVCCEDLVPALCPWAFDGDASPSWELGGVNRSSCRIATVNNKSGSQLPW